MSGLVAGATQLYFPQAIGRVMEEDRLAPGLALVIFVVLCVGGFGRFGEKIFFSTASQRLIARLRGGTFDSMRGRKSASSTRSARATSRAGR